MKTTLAILLMLLIAVGCGESERTPNLTACPDCGEKVSKRAAACPHCGAPTDRDFDKRHVIFNSNVTGVTQVYAATVPAAFLEKLAPAQNEKPKPQP